LATLAKKNNYFSKRKMAKKSDDASIIDELSLKFCPSLFGSVGGRINYRIPIKDPRIKNEGKSLSDLKIVEQENEIPTCFDLQSSIDDDDIPDLECCVCFLTLQNCQCKFCAICQQFTEDCTCSDS
jgi:hypothetical protein